MRRFAAACDAVAATTKKTIKVSVVSELLRTLSLEDAARAAIFLTGRPFAHHDERVLGVGGSQLVKIVAQMADASEEDLGKTYRAHGDLGDMAEHLLLKRPSSADISLHDVAQIFSQLPNLRTSKQKMELLRTFVRTYERG